MSNSFRSLSLPACALAAIAGASTAHADAECVKGFRDTTAAERAAVTTALETVKKALPAAPEGWQIVGDDKVSVPTTLCRDFEQLPWRYGFSRTYSNATGHESRERAAKDAAARAAAEQQKNQARLDALSKRMNDVMQRQMALNQKGDYAGAENLEPERAKAEKEYQALTDEIYRPTTAAVAQAFRDIEMGVSARVNELVTWQAGMQKAPAPAGAHSAYRWTTASEGVRTGHALVLFGQWESRADGGGPKAARRGGAPVTAVHALSVSVYADESRLTAMLNAIDFASLAKVSAK